VFKNRTLLMGLGIGLMTGAILLQMVNFANQLGSPQAAVPQPSESWTTEQLRDAASNKGFIILAKDETWYSKQQLEDAVNKAVTDAEAQWQANASTDASSGTSEEDGFTKGIYIKPRMDASQIAKQLKEFGIIDNSDTFIDSLSQQKLNTKVHFGYFEFPPNASMQDVILAITRQQ
jgi:hypothetical protein